MDAKQAATVSGYLAALPDERRAVVSKVRDVVRRNLPKGYVETMSWGMINYELPLTRYPQTYNGRPLCYAALAAQKNHYALYLVCVYSNPNGNAQLADAFRRAGKKLDMGKSCLRFHGLEDLPLDVIGETIASTPPERLIALYEAGRMHAGAGLRAGRSKAARPKAARSKAAGRKAARPKAAKSSRARTSKA